MSVVSIERLARSILESGADAVVYSDRQGVIGYWNAGAERLFGFRSDEAMGQSLDIIIPESLRARHWHGYQRVMDGGESRYAAGDLLAVPALRKDGVRISVEFTVAPVYDDTGALSGIAAILRDVSARWQETKALKARLAVLEKNST